MVLPSELTPLT